MAAVRSNPTAAAALHDRHELERQPRDTRCDHHWLPPPARSCCAPDPNRQQSARRSHHARSRNGSPHDPRQSTRWHANSDHTAPPHLLLSTGVAACSAPPPPTQQHQHDASHAPQPTTPAPPATAATADAPTDQPSDTSQTGTVATTT